MELPLSDSEETAPPAATALQPVVPEGVPLSDSDEVMEPAVGDAPGFSPLKRSRAHLGDETELPPPPPPQPPPPPPPRPLPPPPPRLPAAADSTDVPPWAGASGELEANDTQCGICDEGGELLLCEGACMRSFCSGCLKITDDELESLLDSPRPWRCPACVVGVHACFACKQLGATYSKSPYLGRVLPDGQRLVGGLDGLCVPNAPGLLVQKCSVFGCRCFYHYDCAGEDAQKARQRWFEKIDARVLAIHAVGSLDRLDEETAAMLVRAREKRRAAGHPPLDAEQKKACKVADWTEEDWSLFWVYLRAEIAAVEPPAPWRCPQHVCHACGLRSGEAPIACRRCPKAYHLGESCMPFHIRESQPPRRRLWLASCHLSPQADGSPGESQVESSLLYCLDHALDAKQGVVLGSADLTPTNVPFSHEVQHAAALALARETGEAQRCLGCGKKQAAPAGQQASRARAVLDAAKRPPQASRPSLQPLGRKNAPPGNPAKKHAFRPTYPRAPLKGADKA
jgi:hypothetical protein